MTAKAVAAQSDIGPKQGHPGVPIAPLSLGHLAFGDLVFGARSSDLESTQDPQNRASHGGGKSDYLVRSDRLLRPDRSRGPSYCAPRARDAARGRCSWLPANGVTDGPEPNS